MATERGFLIIADVSGFTEFTVRSEIEHADGVMQGLIGAVLEALVPPIVVSKLEGDAVFAHLPERAFVQGESLLETLETAYCRFRDLQFQMQKHTTCRCRACVNMRELDLKIVVHHGEYAVSRIGEGDELSGPDVIAVHRLLKNEVRERTGVDAYCLVTEAAVAALGQAALPADAVAHSETVELLGAIAGRVYSLDRAWRAYRERRVARVDPAAAFFVVSEVVPLPPAATWDYMNDDDNWAVWSRATAPPQIFRPASGRHGVGLEKHCVHGADRLTHAVVDWRPFDYFTTDMSINGRIRARYMVTLEPVVGGTRVSYVLSRPWADGAIPGLMIRLAKGVMRRKLRREFHACLVMLREMVESDLAAGRLRADPA